jgi:hypothetical protein
MNMDDAALDGTDDDPSGIATYSQVGVQAGFGLVWTLVLSYPLMVAVPHQNLLSANCGMLPVQG